MRTCAESSRCWCWMLLLVLIVFNPVECNSRKIGRYLMLNSIRWFAAVTVIGVAVVPAIAHAESFSKLARQGYALGKLTKGKAGGYGWVLSDGSNRFFCRLNVATASVNEKEMVSITSSGRLVKVDRAT